MPLRTSARIVGPFELRLDRTYRMVDDGVAHGISDPMLGRVLALVTAMAGSAGARLGVGPLCTALLTYEGSHVAFAPLPDGGALVIVSPASGQPGLALGQLRKRLGELAQPGEPDLGENR